MFPYTVKYTESEYDIQNNDLLNKIDQQCQNTIEQSSFSSWIKQFEKYKIYKNVTLYFI